MNSGELKVDVPLASVESDVEEEEEEKTSSASAARKARLRPSLGEVKSRSASASRTDGVGSGKGAAASTAASSAAASNVDYDESPGSLEDLVNSFDEKLTAVFQNYQEQVDKIAPVQVRSQEEIMNECQVWWTITGNFGSMMPIDWSKSTARAKHLPTLNLAKKGGGRPSASTGGGNSGGHDEDDDLVAADLDMHSLILNSNPCENAEPLKSADEVIKEIDDMIEGEEEDDLEEGDYTPSASGPAAASTASGNQVSFGSFQRSSRIVSEALKGRKLEDLGSNELTQILSDVEILVRDLSEELVNDLSIRDELEFEKELKNTFISLLLSIQSKRRQHAADGGGGSRPSSRRAGDSSRDTYKYLTTVIPYQPDRGPPPLQSLQVLVKILKAINEDSPAVPALLTDYILKVLCPS